SNPDRKNPIPFSTAVVNRGKPGILSVAGDDPFGIWYLPGAGTVDFDQTLYLGPVPDNVQIQQTHSPGDITARFVIGALNARAANPDDDALLLTATKDEQNIVLWRVAVPETIDTVPEPGNPLTLVSSVTGRLTSASSPRLIDLDGDGWRDLAMLFDARDGSQTFLILWSANGNFDFTNATSVPLGPSPINDLVLHGPPDGQHLYAVRKDVILEVTSDERHEIVQSAAFKAASDDAPVAGGRTIAIGDVTGDGLPDLAVAVAGGVRLYRQEANTP
ncbi:MAG TPA: hypothetical protein VKP30_02170, partial [Polyangiaceae bacterium]|nr:hypothetical protein [Polyangiaceae bacterium]